MIDRTYCNSMQSASTWHWWNIFHHENHCFPWNMVWPILSKRNLCCDPHFSRENIQSHMQRNFCILLRDIKPTHCWIVSSITLQCLLYVFQMGCKKMSGWKASSQTGCTPSSSLSSHRGRWRSLRTVFDPIVTMERSSFWDLLVSLSLYDFNVKLISISCSIRADDASRIAWWRNIEQTDGIGINSTSGTIDT